MTTNFSVQHLHYSSSCACILYVVYSLVLFDVLLLNP